MSTPINGIQRFRKIRIGRERFVALIIAISQAEHDEQSSFNVLTNSQAETEVNLIAQGDNGYWSFLGDFFTV